MCVLHAKFMEVGGGRGGIEKTKRVRGKPGHVQSKLEWGIEAAGRVVSQAAPSYLQHRQ